MGEVNISGWGWYPGGHYVKHAPAEKLTEEKMLLRLSQQTTKTKQQIMIPCTRMFSVIYATWVIFYYCYCDPEIPVEFHVLKTSSTL